MKLSREVFAILSGLIEDRTGLRYAPDDREMLAAKLGGRVVDAGFDSFLDYYYFLRYDPAGARELDTLIDTLVVNESYLFREHDQLRVLVSSVIAPAVAEGRELSVWSAACARGEEPYTLAMMLEARGMLDRVRIVASDVSARTVEHARRGELGRRAVRDVPEPDVMSRWVRETPRGPVVTGGLGRNIAFDRVNLVDDEAVRAMGQFDVILCRNVLIYFSDATTRAVVSRLERALRPNGTLWVGVSESLMRLGTSLACEERKGVFFYRRPEP